MTAHGHLGEEFAYISGALARGERKDKMVSEHLRDVSNFTLQFHIKVLTAAAVLIALLALYISLNNVVEEDSYPETPYESVDDSTRDRTGHLTGLGVSIKSRAIQYVQ